MPDAAGRLAAALADRYRIERFVHEIQTTAALTHPHILPLFDSGEATERAMIRELFRRVIRARCQQGGFLMPRRLPLLDMGFAAGTIVTTTSDTSVQCSV